MNKFEALAQFQAWPPGWQRLCAEYWIETGEDQPAKPSDIEARLRNGEAVFFPFDQPKAAKAAAILSDIEERICNGESVFLARNDSHLSDFNSMMFNAKATGKPAAKVAAKARARTKYTLQELDFLDNLIYSELGPTLAVKNFCKRFPNSGHPKESLTTKFHKRRRELKERGDL
jgi:hypothetical protein